MLGHAGAEKINHVADNVRGIEMVCNEKAPKLHECPECAVAKSQRSPSRITRERIEIPLAEVAIDLMQFDIAYNDVRVRHPDGPIRRALAGEARWVYMLEAPTVSRRG